MTLPNLMEVCLESVAELVYVEVFKNMKFRSDLKILAFCFFFKPLYEFLIHNLPDVSDSFFVHGVRILIPVFIYCDIVCV